MFQPNHPPLAFHQFLGFQDFHGGFQVAAKRIGVLESGGPVSTRPTFNGWVEVMVPRWAVSKTLMGIGNVMETWDWLTMWLLYVDYMHIWMFLRIFFCDFNGTSENHQQKIVFFKWSTKSNVGFTLYAMFRLPFSWLGYGGIEIYWNHPQKGVVDWV